MAQFVYAFSGFVGSITSPVTPNFAITGDNSGVAKFTITMDGDVTSHQRAADGSVVISAMTVKNGNFAIETFQNSATDQFLLDWYNTLNSLKERHDVSNWNTTVMSFIDTSSNRQFTFNAVSPKKLPERAYGVQAATVNWELMAAEITQE